MKDPISLQIALSILEEAADHMREAGHRFAVLRSERAVGQAMAYEHCAAYVQDLVETLRDTVGVRA